MADNLYVDIVTPHDRVFQGQASGVRAPGVEGSFEILRNHAPMIAAFGIGTLSVQTEDAHQFADVHDNRVVFATSGGFIEVIDNKITVLAETVEPASEIDVDRARAAEQRAAQRLKEEDLRGKARVEAEADLDRARNRLRVTMGQV